MHLTPVLLGVWRIFAVRTLRGDCPLLTLITGLSGPLEKDGRRMLALLERISRHGPPRNALLSHQIDAGIWQLVQGRLRVVWFYDDAQMLICTHGFVKKSQRTPSYESRRAREARNAYLRAQRRGYLTFDDEERFP